MKKIAKLAYKLYMMGLEKEAELVDGLIKVAGDKIKCPRCGHINDHDAEVCSSCGYDFKTNQENDAKDKKKKKDACYYKVKSRYKKWPSAYASGALVKCREVGASNWGEGGSKKKKKKKSKKRK